MTINDVMKINKPLLRVQSVYIAVLIITGILISKIEININQKKFKAEDLKIDINKADIDTLEKVPYIGQKTASLIIEIRKQEGYFKDINQLKFLSNFEKFKYYLKVEDRVEQNR